MPGALQAKRLEHKDNPKLWLLSRTMLYILLFFLVITFVLCYWWKRGIVFTVSFSFKMETGNVQMSVARIDIPMLKTAYINPGLFAKYFSCSLNQTCHENLINFISRAAYIYTTVLNKPTWQAHIGLKWDQTTCSQTQTPLLDKYSNSHTLCSKQKD